MLPRNVLLPGAPRTPDGVALSTELRGWLGRVVQWSRDLIRALEDDLEATHAAVNQLTEVGDDLTVAATVTLTRRIHRVSGTGSVSRLEPPAGGFAGPVHLLAGTGGWELVVGGNIARPSGLVVAGQALIVVFNVKEGLWYPAT